MHYQQQITFLYITFLITLSSCPSGNGQHLEIPENFGDYWYQGKAEIASYELSQARYGQNNPGHAVLIFVTEDFSKSKQVKLDRPAQNHKDAIKVLKLNAIRKFNTGMYPYSTMTSVFTPVAQSEKLPQKSLKCTFSAQEWCGQVFTQVNKDKSGYSVQWNSYFESEGDGKKNIKKGWLENELWTMIRINPEYLPTGKMELIPSLQYSRLTHDDLDAEKANGELIEKGVYLEYNITYTSIDRSLKIRFEKAYPFKIISWEESFRSGFGENAKMLTTKAELKSMKYIDYWNHNDSTDIELYQELGLPLY
jgi:hypothetical protein